MILPAGSALLSEDVPVLLVLLPSATTAAAHQTRLATECLLATLQQQLGRAIRILPIDQATHPAAVRSFDGRGLPAFVLTRHGVELWHQQGLPEGPDMAALLLSKLQPAPTAPTTLANTEPVLKP